MQLSHGCVSRHHPTGNHYNSLDWPGTVLRPLSLPTAHNRNRHTVVLELTRLCVKFFSKLSLLCVELFYKHKGIAKLWVLQEDPVQWYSSLHFPSYRPLLSLSSAKCAGYKSGKFAAGDGLDTRICRSLVHFRQQFMVGMQDGEHRIQIWSLGLSQNHNNNSNLLK